MTFTEHDMLLRNLGNGDQDDITMTSAEKLICRVYNVADAKSWNEARAMLFSRCRSPEALPPTSNATRLHTRKNYVERRPSDKPFSSTSRDYELVEAE